MGWVVQSQIRRDGPMVRLRNWFPDREFFMRSKGQVRFIKISSRLQMTAAATVVGLTVAWLLTMLIMGFSQWSATRDRAALLQREAEVATSESRVNAYRNDIEEVTADLQKRQDFLESVSENYFGEAAAPEKGGNVSDSTAESAKAVKKISSIIPEAAPLAQLEARQLAFAERLTRLADARSRQVETQIRKFGLNPGVMLASLNDRSAQGGPFLPFFGKNNKAIDPRFARLDASLARMSALERGLAGIPKSLPAQLEFVSSGFGYRHDPFTGSGAMHSGLDFRGPHGAPIFAAAAGTVSFAGWRGGYGNAVEVSHGNGLMTRYAHLSSIRVRPGQRIESGSILGGMGSTGRSTGTHLHFEVRINDRAVNPRPFLEARQNVLQQETSSIGSQR